MYQNLKDDFSKQLSIVEELKQALGMLQDMISLPKISLEQTNERVELLKDPNSKATLSQQDSHDPPTTQEEDPLSKSLNSSPSAEKKINTIIKLPEVSAPTLTETKIETLDQEMISLAFATNNSGSLPDKHLKIDSEAVISLDAKMGVKAMQDIEEDFKLVDKGFTNIKSKFYHFKALIDKKRINAPKPQTTRKRKLSEISKSKIFGD